MGPGPRSSGHAAAPAPRPADLEIELLQGADAWAFLEDPDADRAWGELAARDPKSTYYQSPGFVLPWYGVYRDRCEPVIARGTASGGALVGLMALARRGPERIVHAGDNSAWYHGWISDPGYEGEFPRRAVEEVFRAFPVRRWPWRYLPPGASVDWISTGPAGAGVAPCGARLHESPTAVWDLTDTAKLQKRLRKGRIRNYANRYRRRGELVFERLGPGPLADVGLRAMANWADLRHGALHGDLPYRDDSAKLALHRALLEADSGAALHVLRLDGRFVAIHVGDVENGRFFMGMQGHDPAEGRNSPGTVLLYEIARELAECGVREIDFTPGGEPWKNRYATATRTAVAVEFFRSAAAARLLDTADLGRAMVKRVLQGAGIDPWRLRDRLRAATAGRGTSHTGGTHAASALAEPVEIPLAAPTSSPDGGPAAVPVASAAAIEDILLLDDTLDRDAAQSLLADGLRRLTDGWSACTWRDGRALRGLGWVRAEGAPGDRPTGPENTGRTVEKRDAATRDTETDGAGVPDSPAASIAVTWLDDSGSGADPALDEFLRALSSAAHATGAGRARVTLPASVERTAILSRLRRFTPGACGSGSTPG